MNQILRIIDPHMEMAEFISSTMLRLLLAAFLGGVIGLERALRRKPAGIRTNMFICFGSAMFTVLSIRMGGGDETRIAAQIITGIGFIGAGSILHARGSVSGLTTASTLFVVASIGMATGAGLHVLAIFATMVILVALNALGWFETQFNLKSQLVTYEVSGEKAEDITAEINDILDDEALIMETVHVAKGRDRYRVKFSVYATRIQHAALMSRCQGSDLLKEIHAGRTPEAE